MEDLGYCPKCGHKLIAKYLENEGDIPFCTNCNEYRFKMFNTAISTIVFNPEGDKIALIKQYGRDSNILVAGYVNYSEGLEHALIREVKEELGLDVIEFIFNASEYFAPSNTLMVNFACKVNSNDISHTNQEVDYIKWYSKEEAKQEILKNSLAEKFLNTWLNKNIDI